MKCTFKSVCEFLITFLFRWFCFFAFALSLIFF